VIDLFYLRSKRSKVPIISTTSPPPRLPLPKPRERLTYHLPRRAPGPVWFKERSPRSDPISIPRPRNLSAVKRWVVSIVRVSAIAMGHLTPKTAILSQRLRRGHVEHEADPTWQVREKANDGFDAVAWNCRRHSASTPYWLCPPDRFNYHSHAASAIRDWQGIFRELLPPSSKRGRPVWNA